MDLETREARGASPRDWRIPLARPNVGSRELELVGEVLASGSLALGSFGRQFEQLLAEAAGRRYAIACSSGTAALHLAVRALGIGAGHDVITTPFSFVASANCILYENATPRFVDIEEATLGLDPNLVEAAATDATRGILTVDVFGNPCELDRLELLAAERDWFLIEDSCEAFGSRLNGRALGSFGDVSAFAFYPNKQITTGEGGAALTDNLDLASHMRSMVNQGRDDDGTWLRHVQLGFNYRLDELSSAVGVAQMGRANEMRAGRTRVARAYDRALAGLSWLTVPVAKEGADVDWFVYVVRLDSSIDRDRVMQGLAVRRIPSRPYFAPLHLQPFYRERFGFTPGDFPVTERVAASTLALPFSSLMTEQEVKIVCEALVEVVEERAG